MMATTHPYHHTPAILSDYRRRVRWRRRLAMARWIGRWVLREAISLFWLEAAGLVVLVAVVWRMG